MSQSMLAKPNPTHLSDEKLASLLERSLNNDSQRRDNEAFNCVSHTKRRVTKREGPAYRKINRYFKSRKQYKKERERRKQVLYYHLVEYRTQQYIADNLGVSRSTIKRDLKKLRPYIVRQHNRVLREFNEEQRQRFEQRADGLSLSERFDILSEEMDRIRKLKLGRGYHGHYRIFLLDLTRVDEYGIPKLSILPHQTFNKTLKFPYKIDIRVKGKYRGRGFEASLGTMTLTETTSW